jgi:hypothetical protein
VATITCGPTANTVALLLCGNRCSCFSHRAVRQAMMSVLPPPSSFCHAICVCTSGAWQALGTSNKHPASKQYPASTQAKAQRHPAPRISLPVSPPTMTPTFAAEPWIEPWHCLWLLRSLHTPQLAPSVHCMRRIIITIMKLAQRGGRSGSCGVLTGPQATSALRGPAALGCLLLPALCTRQLNLAEGLGAV